VVVGEKVADVKGLIKGFRAAVWVVVAFRISLSHFV